MNLLKRKTSVRIMFVIFLILAIACGGGSLWANDAKEAMIITQSLEVTLYGFMFGFSGVCITLFVLVLNKAITWKTMLR